MCSIKPVLLQLVLVDGSSIKKSLFSASKMNSVKSSSLFILLINSSSSFELWLNNSKQVYKLKLGT